MNEKMQQKKTEIDYKVESNTKKVKENFDNLKSKIAGIPLETVPAKIANSDEDYSRLNLKRHDVAMWEDSCRINGEPGTYEWWYFDSHLNDGSNLVIAIHSKDDMNPDVAHFAPYTTFEFNTPDGKSFSEKVNSTPEEFIFSKEKCDIHAGKNYFIGDLHEYKIHFENEKINCDVTLTSTLPSWRPETGHWLFGNGEEYWSWLPAVPQGDVVADITIDGEKFHYTGHGYHDHNWSNVSMLSIFHDWYWGRAKIGDYSLISSYITCEKKYGYVPTPVYMLVDPEGNLYDDATKLTFEATDVETDPGTGKPFHNHIVYDYIDEEKGLRFKITYNRDKTIVSHKLVDQLSPMMRLAVSATGFDGAYVRFTGNIVLEKYINGELIDKITDSALWEMMYFGKTIIE